MKAANSWTTYRTRFLVKAKQLTSSLTFTDDLGRIHSGRKGDYLVESSDGVLRIASRQIFEDIYVPLLVGPDEMSILPQTSQAPDSLALLTATPSCQPNNSSDEAVPRLRPASLLPLHLTRKSPQPYRDRHSPNPGLRSL